MRVLLALLLVVIAVPAWGANITATPNKTNPSEKTTVSFTVNHAINTITDRIDTCPGMEVVFNRSSTSTVELHAVNAEDKDFASVAAGALLATFSASTTVPVSVNPGTKYVRFIVTQAETVGESVAEVRCSNIIASTGGGAGTLPSAYGHLYSDVTQTFTANTPTAVTLNNMEAFQGLTHAIDDSRVFVDEAGTIMVNAQPQVVRITGGASQSFFMHLRKNGVEVPNSTREMDVSSTETIIGELAIPVVVDAGDYIEVWVEVSDADVEIVSFAAAAGRPLTPSIIVGFSSIGGTTGNSGVVETVASTTGTSFSDNIVTNPQVNTWNTINPGIGGSAVLAPCGSGRACTIGTTASVPCTDVADGAGTPQVGGSSDGQCDFWGIPGISTQGINPVSTPAFRSTGSAWPEVPPYPYDGGNAQVSAIHPGSYDSRANMQASNVMGTHNMIGPSSANGGTGHNTILGHLSGIFGEAQYSTIIGSDNLILLPPDELFPASGPGGRANIIGSFNEIYSPYSQPSFVSTNDIIGSGNTINGSVIKSLVLGRDSTITGDVAPVAPMTKNTVLGANARVGEPQWSNGQFPDDTLSVGTFSDVWLSGQTIIQSAPGWQSDDIDRHGGLQEWTVMSRRLITTTAATSLPLAGSGADQITFTETGAWRFEDTTICIEDTDMNADTTLVPPVTGLSQDNPAMAVWEQKGVMFVTNLGLTNEKFDVIYDGVRTDPQASQTPETAIATGTTGNLNVPALIAYNGTATAADASTWLHQIRYDSTLNSFNSRVTLADGTDAYCTTNLKVKEIRIPLP